MLPHTRARLELNAEYHEALAAQYNKMVEDKQQSQKSLPAGQYDTSPEDRRPPQEDREMKEHQTLIKMHSDAAKQLRDLLNAEQIMPAIQQAEAQRTVFRNRGPVARTLMH
jgi:hypothetical protein